MTAARTIAPGSVPGKAPFRPTPVWAGEHGPWHLSATRLEGDPLLHAVALHLGSGIVHAERLSARTPADLKKWADTLPATVGPEGAA